MSSTVRIIAFVLILACVEILNAATQIQIPNAYPNDPEYTSCILSYTNQYNNWMEINNQTSEFAEVYPGESSFQNIYVGEIWETKKYYVCIGFEGDPNSPNRTKCNGRFEPIWCTHKTKLPNQLETIQTNNTCKPQIAYGSVIDYDQKILMENIPLGNSGLSLNYSSDYNSYKKSNTHFKISMRPGDYALYSQIADANGTEIQTQMFKNEYDFPWNGSSGIVINDSIQTIAELELSSIQSGSYYQLINPNCDWRALTIDCYTTARSFNVVGQFQGRITNYKTESHGLFGWNLAEMHFFSKQSKILFTGSGQKIKYDSFKSAVLPEYGTVNIVVEKNFGNEVYIFDQDGRHLETRNLFLNHVQLKFIYNSDKTIKSVIDQFGNTTQFQYDGNQRLYKIILKHGQEINITSDLQRRLTEVQLPGGQKYEMGYDGYNRLTSFKHPNQELTQFNYNSDGELVSESKNTGVVQQFYDEINDFFTEQVHRLGFGIATKYKRTDIYPEYVKIEKLDSNNQSISATTNYYQQQRLTDIFGLTTVNSSFTNNNVWGKDYSPIYSVSVRTTESSQNININESINENIQFLSTSNPLLIDSKTVMTRYQTDSIRTTNRTAYSTYADGSTDQYVFNAQGQVTLAQPAYSQPQLFSYYPNGQLQKIQKGTNWTSYSYDQYGYLSAITNSKNQTTTFSNDSDGNVQTKTLPNGDQIRFEYTSGNALKKIIAPNGQTHVFNRTLGDYILNTLTPNQKTTSYEFDNDRRLTEIEKPSGKTITLNYKPQSPDLQSITTPTGTLTLNQMDPQGRLKSLTSADQIRLDIDWVYLYPQKYTWYDENNQMIGQIELNYKPDEFKIREIKVNNQKVTDINYDYTGRIYGMNIGSPTSQFASYQYPHSGYTRTTVSSLNGLQSVYSTTDDLQGNQPTATVNATIKENPNLQMFLTMKRTFDTFGNASEFTLSTLKTDTGIYNNYYTLTPTYDANDRLVQIAKNRKSYINSTEINSTDFINNYMYPPASNNNVKEYAQQSSPTTQPHKRTVATHSIDDQLTTLRGSINRDYQYTDDGDLKSMTNCFGTTHYDYDVFGNLKKVTLPNNKIIEYKVDGLNRRIQKLINGQTTEYYLWYDQLKLAAILDENKSPKLIYIYGPESQNTPSYVIHNNTTYKILHDPGLGSVRYIIEPTTQQIVQEIEYDEFGNMMKNSNPDFQPILFSGGLYDFDTKLYRFGARDYDPTVGRWTTKDPIGFAGGDTNLYAYVGGNPMSYVDPSGLAQCKYSISSGKLVCKSNESSAIYEIDAFSGDGRRKNDPNRTSEMFGPILPGSYEIKKASSSGPYDWFLDPGLIMRGLYKFGKVRGAFNLHLNGQTSTGCITAKKQKDTDALNSLLNSEAGSNFIEVGQ